MADDFELVFCVSDRDQASFDDYNATVPFDNRQAKADLSTKFAISDIPSLFVLGPVINARLRSVMEAATMDDGTNKEERAAAAAPLVADFSHHPPTVRLLGHGCGRRRKSTNTHTSLSWSFLRKAADDDEQAENSASRRGRGDQTQGLLFAPGRRVTKAKKTNFFLCHASRGLTAEVRRAVKLPRHCDDVTMILLDVPDTTCTRQRTGTTMMKFPRPPLKQSGPILVNDSKWVVSCWSSKRATKRWQNVLEIPLARYAE